MTRRQRRMMAVGALVVGAGTAVALALVAFQSNLIYFYSPSEVLAGELPPQARIRLGGIVEEGSVQRSGSDTTVTFRLADCEQAIPVRYSGILPDLFREGQGIVAIGTYDVQSGFSAEEVLAKHDENYMPPELEESLKDKAGTSCMPVANT
ncbi:cytochrome c maturation protein CcmE [uncultured Abyssibacter sp.]|uniref:cytochrome c maturation protein CcmE n=1 Tax=uncultured Abyssibacter sp. TaxID=2320202 RepID=UPI0032B27446